MRSLTRAPYGRPLSALDSRQCRFPVSRADTPHRFCAQPVSDWRPGKVGGCYCDLHVSVTTGQGTETERRAHRWLEVV